MNQITDYNISLINNKTNITIIDYVKQINKLKFNIDISFIDEFIELVSKDECCIHHNMLQKYGILTLKGTTSDIKRMFDQYELEENLDYNLHNVMQVRLNRGEVIKKEYYLHPNAFKICLIRSKNTKKYAKYYILLEQCIKYYNDYQKIIEKDNNIQELKDLIKNMEKILINANIKLDDTLEKLDKTHDILEETNEKLDITDNKLNIVAKKLDIAVEERVINTSKTSTLEYFIVMKNNNNNNDEYKYYIIRGQKRYIIRKKADLNGYAQIKILECVPNAKILWGLIKQELKNKVEYSGNKLNLITINEDKLLKNIDEIYNKRKNETVT
jgi:hypothetical protein